MKNATNLEKNVHYDSKFSIPRWRKYFFSTPSLGLKDAKTNGTNQKVHEDVECNYAVSWWTLGLSSRNVWDWHMQYKNVFLPSASAVADTTNILSLVRHLMPHDWRVLRSVWSLRKSWKKKRGKHCEINFKNAILPTSRYLCVKHEPC